MMLRKNHKYVFSLFAEVVVICSFVRVLNHKFGNIFFCFEFTIGHKMETCNLNDTGMTDIL